MNTFKDEYLSAEHLLVAICQEGGATGVCIQDSALIGAAFLSDRYISDRFLPDKAIDLIDEAASRLRIEIDSMPVEIDEIERRIKQLEIEKQALKREKDQSAPGFLSLSWPNRRRQN